MLLLKETESVRKVLILTLYTCANLSSIGYYPCSICTVLYLCLIAAPFLLFKPHTLHGLHPFDTSPQVPLRPRYSR